ncbi:dihydrofolate reductase [Kineobactrum sediminis]|uniref:Dihydrofolate reductase n=1 Tax=Kineobactrum sediminis TaxID=1905677 RepID=A0A2N5Y592_9GAMM|nr:dihydrofolate reductase [Kineobactrum sediminis]PLW83557.1 dihydrofolate reductase [Kineobactrum sediminis]
MTIALMVAMAANGVIGRDGGLPWHLSEDLRYFKRTTMGKPIIMGRKTWESIGRPLPGRPNIVVSRSQNLDIPGVHVEGSLGEALELAAGLSAATGIGEVMVIGGAQLYEAALPRADRLYVTEIHAQVEGDTLFPAVDWQQWREISREEHPSQPPNPYSYAFVVYERVGASKWP